MPVKNISDLQEVVKKNWATARKVCAVVCRYADDWQWCHNYDIIFNFIKETLPYMLDEIKENLRFIQGKRWSEFGKYDIGIAARAQETYVLDARAIWQREGISKIMVRVLCDCKINVKALYHCALTLLAL